MRPGASRSCVAKARASRWHRDAVARAPALRLARSNHAFLKKIFFLQSAQRLEPRSPSPTPCPLCRFGGLGSMLSVKCGGARRWELSGVTETPLAHARSYQRSNSNNSNRPTVSDFDWPGSRERQRVVICPLAGARGYRKVRSSKIASLWLANGMRS